MEIKFERIEGKSIQYQLVMGIFAAFVVAGGLATWWIIKEGIWITGMNNRVPWGLQIVMAVYYIGLSAGSQRGVGQVDAP